MSESDPALQFAAQHLGGRPMPDDLRKLLNLQWHNAARGSPNGLNGVGVTFSDRLPALIDAECAGGGDLEGIARLAYAQAMADIVVYYGFVAVEIELRTSPFDSPWVRHGHLD